MKRYPVKYRAVVKLIEDVSKQSHYTANKIEPIEYIRNVMSREELRGYYWGNVIKYISRWKLKNGAEDLKKARVYLDWLITLEETPTSNTSSTFGFDATDLCGPWSINPHDQIQWSWNAHEIKKD